jgi:hypothetical protein
MAELTGRVTAFAPLARLAAATSGTKLARVSAFVYGVRHAAELRAAAGEARRAAGVSSPSRLSRGPGAPGVVPRESGAGGRPPGSAERAAGVSSPSRLSRGPGAPGVVPRESGAGGRPPGPALPAGRVGTRDRTGGRS